MADPTHVISEITVRSTHQMGACFLNTQILRHQGALLRELRVLAGRSAPARQRAQ
jgi:hypothetical protein